MSMRKGRICILCTRLPHVIHNRHSKIMHTCKTQGLDLLTLERLLCCYAQPSHTVIRAIFIDDTYPIIVTCVLTVVFKWQYVDIFFQNDKKFILLEPNRLLH